MPLEDFDHRCLQLLEGRGLLSERETPHIARQVEELRARGKQVDLLKLLVKNELLSLRQARSIRARVERELSGEPPPKATPRRRRGQGASEAPLDEPEGRRPLLIGGIAVGLLLLVGVGVFLLAGPSEEETVANRTPPSAPAPEEADPADPSPGPSAADTGPTESPSRASSADPPPPNRPAEGDPEAGSPTAAPQPQPAGPSPAPSAPELAQPAPAGIDVDRLRRQVADALTEGELDEAERAIEEARLEASTDQLPELERLRAEVEAARAVEAEWPTVKGAIAKQWKLKEGWEEVGREVDALKGFLADDLWAIRAMGVVGLGQLGDRRGLGHLALALEDKNPAVIAFALLTLEEQRPDEIRQAEGGTALMEAVLGCLRADKLSKHLSARLLRRLSGQEHRNASGWKSWWEGVRSSYVPDVRPPYDLSPFTEDALRRFHRERGNAVRGDDRGTVLRGDEFREELRELRKQGLDIVYCLDVTGSMGAVLDESKAKIELLSTILHDVVGNYRMGFVSYRDQVAAREDLTDNWRAIREILFGQQAAGGGDGPEGVEKGVEVALKEMRWRRTAARSIVIVGDAPPHAEDMDTFRELADLAKANQISIHALYVAGEIPQIEEIVRRTGGRSARLGGRQAFLEQFLSLVFGERFDRYLGAFIERYLEIRELLTG